MHTKHPQGLIICCLTEMWERFGFYIVQGLLVLYLTHVMKMPDKESYAISGGYTAFIYISPLIGGYIADKILGYRNSIFIGSLLFIVGYGLLSLLNPATFYIALAIIVLGNGFFKPNIASLLGTLYHKDDSRREAGFTYFYMGINVGVILATLSAGFVTERFGYSAGFLLACVGLCIGFITFLWGAKRFNGSGIKPAKFESASKFLRFIHSKVAVILGMIVAVPLITLLIKSSNFANIVLLLVAGGLIVGISALALQQKDKIYRNRIFALLILNIITVIFWAVFFQIFFSLNLFIDRNVDRHLFGIQIPTIAFISLESIFIILLGPFLAKLWTNLGLKHRNPAIPIKFFWGFIAVSVAFLILAVAAFSYNKQGLASPAWIPLGYFFITVAEMLISPIVIAAVTQLSPSQWVGMMMGVYLIGIGYGGKIGGMIAGFSSIPESITSPLVQSHYYGKAFISYAVMGFVAAILILILTPLLKRLIGKTS